TSAPFASSVSTIFTCPPNAAAINGVTPFTAAWFTSVPASSIACAIATSLRLSATTSAVSPSRLRAFGDAPLASARATPCASPFRAAARSRALIDRSCSAPKATFQHETVSSAAAIQNRNVGFIEHLVSHAPCCCRATWHLSVIATPGQKEYNALAPKSTLCKAGAVGWYLAQIELEQQGRTYAIPECLHWHHGGDRRICVVWIGGRP